MTLRQVLERPAPEAARALIGVMLITEFGGIVTSVELTETEAYTPDDPASHSFGGETRRNRSMFGRAGTLYVYRSYGIHWCANVTTGPVGHGAAVLLRAGRVIAGAEEIRRRRGRDDHLTDGPGKLCQALAVTGTDDGIDLLSGGRVRLEPGTARPIPVRAVPRVGISRAREVRWRFVREP